MAGVMLSMGSGDLLMLNQAELGPGAPPGWQIRQVKGQHAPALEIRDDGGDRVLRISGTGQAAWFYRDLRNEDLSDDRLLRWSWRVLEAPSASDLQRKQTDDSPIRVYVVFGNPRALFGGSGRIIFYSFGNAEPDGYAGQSHQSGRMHVVRVDGASERGVWREHAAHPANDYRRIWGRTPPPITAVGVMQDTDQTGRRAVAELRQLGLGAPLAETPLPEARAGRFEPPSRWRRR
ncbi:MAG: DUF3047 domain-containing protein [Gemmatimonadales bacterium]|nr:DUF3047 domain-containing protein [Gemmatimonadales bacterium]